MFSICAKCHFQLLTGQGQGQGQSSRYRKSSIFNISAVIYDIFTTFGNPTKNFQHKICLLTKFNMAAWRRFVLCITCKNGCTKEEQERNISWGRDKGIKTQKKTRSIWQSPTWGRPASQILVESQFRSSKIPLAAMATGKWLRKLYPRTTWRMDLRQLTVYKHFGWAICVL